MKKLRIRWHIMVDESYWVKLWQAWPSINTQLLAGPDSEIREEICLIITK